jgi:hypothetical protein
MVGGLEPTYNIASLVEKDCFGSCSRDIVAQLTSPALSIKLIPTDGVHEEHCEPLIKPRFKCAERDKQDVEKEG